MKTMIRCLFSVVIIFSLLAMADGAGRPPKKKKATPIPIATPTPPPSSAELSTFMSAHLETILGPPGAKVDAERAELAKLRDGFAKEFGKASLADRKKFQLGLAVCDAISEAMNARTRAASMPAMWPQQAAQLRQKIDQLAAQQKAAEGH
jgi:hypothetical protein